MTTDLNSLTDAEKAADYHRAGKTQCEGGTWQRPTWVPSKVRLPKRVRGDFPYSQVEASPGDYECETNRNGAVSVKSSDGSLLGLRPHEFEVLEWRKNEDGCKGQTRSEK